ncbi:MAG: DUF285 domain-containing protein [Candidatus Lokiarchaeota archaeon]|nr:DUF285 domain-containing protein [Candidatus Lokiarchaeota archaeon]
MINKKIFGIFTSLLIIISSVAAAFFFFSFSNTIDTIDPTVKIESPHNNIYDNSTQLINITASDDLAIDSIWYNWNNTNMIYTSPHYITFNEGLNTIHAWANDSAGNIGHSSVIFIIDTISPLVQITNPVNTTYNNATQLLTITTSDNIAIDTIWYNWNGTKVIYNSPHSITFNKGLNTIHAWVNDSVGNIATTSVTFTIDIPPVIVKIESPINKIYYNPKQLLNISASSDDYTIDTIWYVWNCTKVIYNSPHYITFNEGLNTIHAWANDTEGHIATAFVTFTIDAIDPNLTFTSVWNTILTSSGSSNSTQVKLPLEFSGTYNFTVNWGDGKIESITSWNQTGVTHTYALSGIYTIKINGILAGWNFNNGRDKLKLLKIAEWGDLRLGNSGNYFYGCSNLNLTACDTLGLIGTTTLYQAFSECSKLGDTGNMSSWDVSGVKDMSYMFYLDTSFNQDISNWNVSSVTNMELMFYDATSFNQDIEKWDVSNVQNMFAMFYFATSFNQSIGDWDVSNVENVQAMFYFATSFNQDISDWNVSGVTNMAWMFYGANSFNQDIGDWDVSTTTRMDMMFYGANSFNQNIGDWNVSKVTTMTGMFYCANSFNQSIGNWDVSNVKYMSYMFYGANSFNQDISDWNVSRVTSMSTMFYMASSFNQDIGNWDVSSVKNMGWMFYHASSFDQNLGNWNVSNVEDMDNMFDGITLSTNNYDNLLIGWSKLTLKRGVSFDGGYSHYSTGEASDARTYIKDTFGWYIYDGGQVP